MKQKKPIYKRLWFWVVLVILIIGLGGLGGEREKTEPTTETAVVREVSKEEPQAQEPEPTASQTAPAYSDPNTREAHFLLNKESMIFHDTGCNLVRDSDNPNIVPYTGTRQSVIDMGYSPCGRCHP